MLLEPRKALNKAFLKIKPNRTGIELFKQNLIQLLDSIKDKESEELIINAVLREKEKGRIILMISHSDISDKISNRSYNI